MERDPIFALVASGAPARDSELLAGPTVELVDALARSASADVRRLPRSVTRRRLGVVLAAGLALVAATSVAAHQFSAHTGLFGNPDFTEEDGSEWLRTNAPDFPEVVRSLIPSELPLPPGYSWEPEVARQAQQGREHGGLQQATGVRSTFAFYAYCAWLRRWYDARAVDDLPGQSRAKRVLAAVPSWAAIGMDGGGVRQSLADVAAATRSGNVVRVQAELGNNCAGYPLRTGS
jgi:hypothetical protein